MDYLVKLIDLARQHDFILVFDECYSEIYRGDPPIGGLQVCAKLGGDLSNVVVLHSLSKRSSAPGLRCGFVAGDPNLIDAYRTILEVMRLLLCLYPYWRQVKHFGMMKPMWI